jgi:dTDP-4-amino-4,6-dideoxygalactose transaminase
LPKLKKFCEAHNIYLIEDDAHGFLSKMDNKSLGSFGAFLASERLCLCLMAGY